MENLQRTHNPYTVHRGPHPGIVATVHVTLFMAGLLLLGIVSKGRAFPNPYNDLKELQQSLFDYVGVIRFTAFLQFGSTVPLAIFISAVTSRLSFLGVNVTGVNIAFYGGIAASILMTISSLCNWILTQQGIATNIEIMHVLQFFGFSTGGVAFIVALGLMMAGISVPCLFGRYTPRWVAVLGLILAICAELSALSLLIFPATFLLPIARFGSFVWMIATGFTLVKSKPAHAS